MNLIRKLKNSKVNMQTENEIIILMKRLRFNQNETVAILLLLDKYKADKEREMLLKKLQNNEITTQENLRDFAVELRHKYKKHDL